MRRFCEHREYSGDDVRRVDGQALKDAECADAKVRSKDGEVRGEEALRPANLGEEEGHDLKYDEEAVDNSPEGACGLIRYSRVPAAELSVHSN